VGRLFQPFMQADTSISRKFGGTGLGLAITFRLAGMMGGTIAVRSRLGEGSVFRVELPLPADPRALPGVGGSAHPMPRLQGLRARVEAGANPLAPIAKGKDPSPSPPRVLLAEDNTVNQKVGKRMLEKMGCAVAIAVNGAEALRLRFEREFDVILMDCMMPVMDGYEATRAIRAREGEGIGAPRIPIIACTASVTREDIYLVYEAGMDDFLGKPYRPEQLLAMLGKWTHRGVSPAIPASGT
jgi:CheY-like chemotaxis protein